MAQDRRVEALRGSLVFSGLTEEMLHDLAELAVEEGYEPGRFVFWEGEPAHSFFMVSEGRVKVLKHSSTGKELIVAFFGPGEMFGEVGVFEDKPYPASAQAVERSAVLRIAKDDFLSFIAARPQVSLKAIQVLSARLRDAQSRLRDVAAERAQQRLAGLLLMLSSKLGPRLPFTREEIGQMAGMTTETTIRLVSQLAAAGVVRPARGTVEIVDEDKLRLLREGPPGG
ncbi:MAG: Crp/Fnr family transcriptional regulator [Chloroflexota bacterium]